MVRWVKGFMNQPILKAATNVRLICTYIRGEVLLKWNEVHANGNIPLLLGNAVRKAKLQNGNRGTGVKDQNHDTNTRC
jgi:hypothetical protein